jgi:hypothetical protein
VPTYDAGDLLRLSFTHPNQALAQINLDSLIASPQSPFNTKISICHPVAIAKKEGQPRRLPLE